jgi:DNA polymerase I-like protein with 3'-5' exonuclease and polymerase domains
VGCVHDEFLLEAPIETEDEVAMILKKTMELAGKEFLEKVPVLAEVNVGNCWAEK